MVALFEKMMEPCQRLSKLKQSDGEGGWKVTWVEGGTFEAAVNRAGDTRARIAESMGVEDLYTVTTHEQDYLAFHDVFRRLRDGKVFRVTGDAEDRRTPDVATFSFRRVTAQEWELES